MKVIATPMKVAAAPNLRQSQIFLYPPLKKSNDFWALARSYQLILTSLYISIDGCLTIWIPRH